MNGYKYANPASHFIPPRLDKKSEIESFLNDTLLTSFLPQVEDTVAQKFRAFVNNPDAFRVETIAGAARPVFRVN